MIMVCVGVVKQCVHYDNGLCRDCMRMVCVGIV